jgi:hypothetical protein
VVQADQLGDASRPLAALDLDRPVTVHRNALGGTSSASAMLTRPRGFEPVGTGAR